MAALAALRAQAEAMARMEELNQRCTGLERSCAAAKEEAQRAAAAAGAAAAALSTAEDALKARAVCVCVRACARVSLVPTCRHGPTKHPLHLPVHNAPLPPQIKVAMLDSANETIAALKAELEDYAAEADEARRAVEEAEAHAAQQAEADAQEKASLRWVRRGGPAPRCLACTWWGSGGRGGQGEATGQERGHLVT